MSEQNTAVYARFHEAVNSGDFDLIAKTIDEVVDPNVIFHAPVPMGVPGQEAMKRVWTVLLRAYPDVHVTTEDVIVEGDKVVYRQTVTGTHQGEAWGVPATGRHVTYSEIFIVRFADGKIVEIWGVVDVLAQLRQLGVLPG
ncbi:ester cyclase [Asanoa sp. NPDC049573]|uniref:ester cyclase n=1 Tax=Asanoa sp. NPDC049573 TaxID=3155396 RepID=UPI003446AFE9